MHPNLQSVFATANFYVQSGRLDQAEGILKNLLGRPDCVAAAAPLLSTIYCATNRPRQAIDLLETAISNHPRVAELHYELGNAKEISGDAVDAEEAFRTALRCDPNFAEAHHNLANLFRKTGRLTEAEQHARRATELNPGLAPAWMNLATILEGLRRLDEAVAVGRKCTELHPQWPDSWNTLGNLLVTVGRGEEARRAYERALELKPDFVEALNNLGSVQMTAGELDDARKTFEKVLEFHPNYPPTLRHLTLCRRYETPDAPEVVAIEQTLLSSEISDSDRAVLHFGLAKVHDDCKQYDQAFEQYQEANRLMHLSSDYDSDFQRKTVDHTIEIFHKKFFVERKNWGIPDETPVFVFGMPRSGTTLTEQIIASHPQAHGAGEMTAFGQIMTRIGNTFAREHADEDIVEALTPTIVQQIAEEYLSELRRDVDDSVLRISDKMPFSFIRLGMIALALPKARFVQCHRHPLDICLSNYFQLFTRGNSYSYDLDDIASFYCQYERLMAHWKKVLPIDIFDIHYEELVDDLPAQAHRLVDHIGLEWDDACVDFHRTKRQVLTASSWQVRQPVYKSSVARWKRYEKFVEPLRKRLAECGVETDV
ncbi:MAG: sulfotransferase [Gammaproteobacteria bacterium]